MTPPVKLPWPWGVAALMAAVGAIAYVAGVDGDWLQGAGLALWIVAAVTLVVLVGRAER